MVKISTNIKNFIETITKGLSYTKTEMDTKLNNKANTNHSHTSENIDLEEGGEDSMWIDYGVYTQSAINGFVYDHEKKLENIDDGANKTVVDSSLSLSSTNPVQNKVVNSALNGKANSSHSHSITDVTNLQSSLDSKAGTSIATTSANGLMSSSDKTKLDGIATGATKVTVDTSLSSSSTNPVQNKVINTALNRKSDTGHEHTSDEIRYAYDQNVSVTTILENKAAKNHTHDYIPSTVSQTVFGSGDSKVTATRQGNVVTLRLYLAGEFTESWRQWCTITDSQYLPDTDGGFTDFGISSSHGTHMLLRINSDGRVRTGYGQNKTSYCYQTITFLKNN